MGIRERLKESHFTKKYQSLEGARKKESKEEERVIEIDEEDEVKNPLLNYLHAHQKGLWIGMGLAIALSFLNWYLYKSISHLPSKEVATYKEALIGLPCFFLGLSFLLPLAKLTKASFSIRFFMAFYAALTFLLLTLN